MESGEPGLRGNVACPLRVDAVTVRQRQLAQVTVDRGDVELAGELELHLAE